MRSIPLTASAVTLICLGVAACGGGGSSGGSGNGGVATTSTSSGTITGFGSVFVNGVEFETDDSTFDVDDDANALESDLALGMVVTVTGTVDSDGNSGTAEQIQFDYDVEGPISDVPQLDADGLTKTFTVLGTTVVVDANGTVFNDDDPRFTFNTVSQSDIVEASGFVDQNHVLHATEIEKKQHAIFNPDGTLDDVEIKGAISNLAATQDSFKVRDLTVQVTGDTERSKLPGSALANGLFVEVKGTLSADGTMLAAAKIEHQGFEDDAGDVGFEGIITNFVDASRFRVNGQQIDASNAEFEPAALEAALGNGLQVEVEGSIAGGILKAEKIEGREGSLKIEATVASVAGNTIAMRVAEGQPAIGVSVDTRTRMEDDLSDLSPFTAADISAGDFLEIEAFGDGRGTLLATQLQRAKPGDMRLQGPVDVFDASAQTLTILGVTVATDAATEFEDSDNAPINSAADFFNTLTVGTTVKIEDTLSDLGVSDGIADVVELENVANEFGGDNHNGGDNHHGGDN